MDLTKIPEFHLRVVKVNLLSGKTLPRNGRFLSMSSFGRKPLVHRAGYRNCPAAEDRHWLPEDTFGISKILSDYRVETTFRMLGPQSTRVAISHYYSITTLRAKLLNFIAKGKIARETQRTLNAAKDKIEAACQAG